ncbi:MAG: SDR family oxidoreductase [Proteobacteria bacterium]|nr:SDR family oxidoreductase [Pseudomonadota bacterium]
MENPLDMTGRVAIVTGGAKGVGRGISQSFLDAGAEVVVCGRNAPDSLPGSGGREAVFVPADVRDAEQIDRVATQAEERFGRIDTLVNNAGGTPEVPAMEGSPRYHDSIIRLNLTSALHFAQRANRTMQKQETGGVIINISSVSGVRPSPGSAAYGAAKAGLVHLSSSLAVEWAPKVRIVTLISGYVRTEQTAMHYGSDEGLAATEASIPLGRLADPSEIGNVCLYLASPLASFVTGGSILAHGGGERPLFLDTASNRTKT